MARAHITQTSLAPFLGQGLLVSSGAYHHGQRKAVQPIFTPTWTTSYIEAMEQCIGETTESWNDGQVRNIAQDMLDLSAAIIYRTVFGTRASQSQAVVRTAIDTLQHYANQVMRGGTAVPEATRSAAVEQLDRVVQDLIRSHQSAASQSDFLSRLLTVHIDNEVGLSETQIRDEVVTMLVAGHETTGNALAWLFYLLALHPTFQATLRQEVSNLGDFGGLKSISWLSLPTADLVIKEALRLYPPAWLVGRSPVETIEIGGYTIQPSATIVICPYALHRTPTFFPDPDQFLPERFRTEPPPYTFLPFGAGPHVCIGQAFAMQEMLLTVTRLVANWQFELVDAAPPDMEALITLRPKNGIRLRIHNI